jgi:MFS family permease
MATLQSEPEPGRNQGRKVDRRAALDRDSRILFTTRVVRLFGYGALSIILVLYLAEAGLTDTQIGLLLTLTLLGDTVISLWMTLSADRVGRRRMLMLGAVLMVLAGGLFAGSRQFWILLAAAIVGVISPSGYEVGPFLSIEQASLSQIVPGERRTHIFAWYNLVGSFATAAGAFAAGAAVESLQKLGASPLESYRAILMGYGATGGALLLLFTRLSSKVEISRPAPQLASELQTRFGLHRSRKVVLKLSALFSLDAFAGGFVLQSVMAYWFHRRFGVSPGVLGSIFLGANILAGVSALSAGALASRFGLINTMVFTHIPSNLLLILVPLMPTLPLAVAMLLLRFSISQMDVPTRQSYTMAVVSPDERSAAAGVTGIARTLGASLSPIMAGPLLANAGLLSVPFFLSGGLKIVYDLLLYRSFKALKPPEEKP